MHRGDEFLMPKISELEQYLCVWCQGIMPLSPSEYNNFSKCSCILCDMCRERILIKDRIENSRKCRKCLYGFVY